MDQSGCHLNPSGYFDGGNVEYIGREYIPRLVGAGSLLVIAGKTDEAEAAVLNVKPFIPQMAQIFARVPAHGAGRKGAKKTV